MGNRQITLRPQVTKIAWRPTRRHGCRVNCFRRWGQNSRRSSRRRQSVRRHGTATEESSRSVLSGWQESNYRYAAHRSLRRFTVDNVHLHCSRARQKRRPDRHRRHHEISSWQLRCDRVSPERILVGNVNVGLVATLVDCRHGCYQKYPHARYHILLKYGKLHPIGEL
jgi:hypothetical protein